MTHYIIRRLLLSIPTFLGVTVIFFLILQLLPGGPVEQVISQRFGLNGNQGSTEGGGGGNSSSGTMNKQSRQSQNAGISPEALQRLREYYGVDKPILTRYLIWIGFLRREIAVQRFRLGAANDPNQADVQRQLLRILHFPDNSQRNLQRWLRLERQANGQVVVYSSPAGLDFPHPDSAYQALPDYHQLPQRFWQPDLGYRIKAEAKSSDGSQVFKIYKLRFRGALQGYLGDSYSYSESVTAVIARKMPLSMYFGLSGLLLTYLISIPLGLFKALQHRSLKDFFSTFAIFLGYATPGYILGIFLISLFTSGGAARELFHLGNFSLKLPFAMFPVGDVVSDNFRELNLAGKLWDLLQHMVLPTIAWNIASFASLTMLMKNTVLEELSQDYVRTAFAKGLPENKVVYRHVLKNALVPIAPGITSFFFIFFTGSMLIEKTFNIQGMGLLSYNAMLSRDYPIVMGFTFITTIISLIAGIIGDLMYAVVDPRIRFR